MNKVLTLFLLLTFVQISSAQFLWYENETDTYQIEFESETSGIFATNVINPNSAGINTNSIVSKFNRDAGTKSFLRFDLYSPIIDFTGYSITLKAYLDVPTASLTSSNSKLRVFFEHSSVSGTPFQQLNFTVGQAWQTFTFDFNGTTIPQDILDAGGYDLIKLGFATGSTSEPAMTYYIDAISGTTEQVANTAGHQASWLAGSWGITFPVYGGERLDSEVAGGYNYSAGAQEIVDELPATGHVITNLSNFAKSYYFTLRGNPNVDIATEIDELLVPSIGNEAIIFDVLQKFKNAGKKNILYISTNYFDRLASSTDVDFNTAHAAWVTYYTNNFAGNEYLAYKDLVQGFIIRIKDYADGYWLDTTAELDDDGNLEDFIAMIRAVDPSAAISASPNGAYFTENGQNILVDTDGSNDNDPTDYKIVSFEGVNTYQDYTSGHVTPLGQGAPPNSWAYEEFTIPAMVQNPWSMYQGNTVLRHAWFPVREKWHVSSQPIVFGVEDAYRFAKRLIDANAGVTFATTINDVGSDKGYMMDDEMIIMKTINDRLLSTPVPSFVPYARPSGAYLLGQAPVLPIDLLFFDGIEKDGQIDLNWQTASELNNKGFFIEKGYRISSKMEWEQLGFVDGNGTRPTPQVYSFIDQNPKEGTNYYRLKQIDYDGNYEYSSVINIEYSRNDRSKPVSIFPNPVRNQLMIINGEGKVTIYNVLGQPVKHLTIEANQESIQLTDLSNGQYYLQLIQEDGTIITKQFSKL